MAAITPAQMLLATSPWPSGKTVSYKIIDKDGTVKQDWTTYGVTERQIDATAALSIYQVVTIGEGMADFEALSQTFRQWTGMAAAPNGNVYACTWGGDIYMQTAGAGNFIAIGGTSRNWHGMCAAPNGNIYACVYGGDIYMQTAGVGAFNALGGTSRDWTDLAANAGGDIYATVTNGDIYKQTGGAGAFNALGETSRDWQAITVASNGNVYACVYNGDIYIQTDGVGSFVALNETKRTWGSITATSKDVYAALRGTGDIYKQTDSVGKFVAFNQTAGDYWGMTTAPSDNVYAGNQGEDIYMQRHGILGGFAGLSCHVFWKTSDATPLIQSQTLNIEGDVCSLVERLTVSRAGYLDNLTDRLVPPTITSLTACAGTLPSGTYTYQITATNETGETGASNEMSVVTTQVATPVSAACTTGAGTLAPATYYYRVSAINAVGETEAFAEVSHVLGGVGGVNVNWEATSGATGYKIYGRSTGAELLMDTVGAVTTWLDDGSVTPSGVLPVENTTNGVQINYDYPEVGTPQSFVLYGREDGDFGSLATISLPPTTTSVQDRGNYAPNTSIQPPSVNDSGIESIAFELINKADAIKTKSDQLSFNVDGRLESVIDYPEGYVISNDANTQIYFATSLTETQTNFWQGCYISFTSGQLKDQTRKIGLYDGSTNFITVAAAFTGTPVHNDTFVIVNK